jgi:phage-related protein
MSQLFGGLATEMNKAFMGVTNVLMTPESQASIGVTIDNIIAGFQHLNPALGQFTQGMVKLVEVGSTFLPQIGDLFTDLMTRFNNLVQTSAADGSLQNFIQKGIDATKYLIDFVIDLGKEIYAALGNKLCCRVPQHLGHGQRSHRGHRQDSRRPGARLQHPDA